MEAQAAKYFGAGHLRSAAIAREVGCRNALQAADLQCDWSPSGPPRRPTGAMPGSPSKVRVLALRARHGVELWHPQDRHYIGENLTQCDEGVDFSEGPLQSRVCDPHPVSICEIHAAAVADCFLAPD